MYGHQQKKKIRENELYHHGIKGMKWGVRRYQNPDGSYTEAGKKRYGIAMAGSMTARAASEHASKRASEVRKNRDTLAKRYEGKAGEKRYLEDAYGKDWDNPKYIDDPEIVEYEKRNARKDINEGLAMMDRSIARYESIAKTYLDKSDRLLNTPIDKLTKKDLKMAKDLIKDLELSYDVADIVETRLLAELD